MVEKGKRIKRLLTKKSSGGSFSTIIARLRGVVEKEVKAHKEKIVALEKELKLLRRKNILLEKEIKQSYGLQEKNVVLKKVIRSTCRIRQEAIGLTKIIDDLKKSGIDVLALLAEE